MLAFLFEWHNNINIRLMVDFLNDHVEARSSFVHMSCGAHVALMLAYCCHYSVCSEKGHQETILGGENT